jgi:hypothetical protein
MYIRPPKPHRFIDVRTGQGEQTVASAVIAGGLVTFSTQPADSCRRRDMLHDP